MDLIEQLRAMGWKDGDPLPDFLFNGPSGPEGPGPEGSFNNPMQLSTMQVPGNLPPPPPQAGAAPPPPPSVAGGSSGPMGPPASRAGAPMDDDIWSGMTDDQASMYAGMGDLGKQRAAAEAMRDTEELSGRYVNQGRTYVGDSPIAHIVRGAKIYKGKKDVKKIGEKQTSGRKAILDLLRKKKGIDEEIIEEVGPSGGGGYM